MFAPDHQAVADELLRVCRPGGTIGMVNFTPEGRAAEFFGALRDATRRRLRPGALPPVLWGSEEHVRDLFGDRVTSLEMTRRPYASPAASPRGYVEFFYETFGPVVALRAVADDPDGRRRSTATFSSSRRARTRGRRTARPRIEYEYLLVVARKRGA